MNQPHARGRRARRAAAALALRAVAALALGGLLAACGPDPPAIPKLAPGAVVLAFGDSLTYGVGAGSEESYPVVLARATGLEVVNAGVPGEVTAEGLRRLPQVLDEVEPALVVLCHGGNDMLRRRDLAAAESDLRAMIDLARARGAAVVLLGVPAPGLLLSTAEWYRRVAEDLAVPLEADVIPDLLGDNRYKSDAVHPNAAGYERIARAVETLLRATGAL